MTHAAHRGKQLVTESQVAEAERRDCCGAGRDGEASHHSLATATTRSRVRCRRVRQGRVVQCPWRSSGQRRDRAGAGTGAACGCAAVC